jgi:hypothetical protein
VDSASPEGLPLPSGSGTWSTCPKTRALSRPRSGLVSVTLICYPHDYSYVLDDLDKYEVHLIQISRHPTTDDCLVLFSPSAPHVSA